MIRRLREKTAIPIILFGYYNPILQYRVDKFCADARAAGADGVLVVDLPPEESAELTNGHPEAEFPLIRLIAPTTPAERMHRIAGSAHGFLYLISKTGVTGSDGLDIDDIAARTASVKAVTDLPVCVGFGEENLNQSNLAGIVAEQVKAFKQATR